MNMKTMLLFILRKYFSTWINKLWGIWYVSDNGDVFTFGESADGRLGLSAHQLANPNHPQRVESLHGFLQVACGGKHTLALTGDGNIHNSVL